MSYYEYDDLFDKCQLYAPYQMFIYDMVDSKNNQDVDRQEKLYKLIFIVYSKLQQLEQDKGIKILHTSNLFNKNGYGYLNEPFLIDGDTIGFTILRDSISSNDVNDIFNKTKKEMNINYDFHLSNGYYETDKYEEGNIKYFCGYCIQKLNTKHKKEKKK